MKGWPEGGAEGLRVADLPTPSLVLRESALAHNVEAMAAWCAERGVALAPHGKTTMAPAIFRRQLDAGAWGLTVFDVRQARVAVEAGAERVLIANEVLDARDLAWIASRPAGSTLFYVDSDEGVARAAGDVLLEVGYAGGRTGVRDDAMALADRIAAAPGLRLAGVAAFEGLLEDGAAIDALLDRVAGLALALRDRFAGPPILSAGGSAHFARVVERLRPAAEELGGTVILRSGCYVTHDHGLYANALAGATGVPELRAALELRGRVLSRPEPGRAIVDVGRRDCGYDSGLPIALDRRGTVTALNDQHAYLDLEDPDDDLAPGDLVTFGISHPCTTLERWRLIPLVDDDDRVIDAIETRF